MPDNVVGEQTTLRERVLGSLLGLALGDAVGAAVEFKPRGSFAPLTEMVGGGPWGLLPGQYTDDTAMALNLAESLIASNGFDARDQMRRYVDWWRNGRWSSTGTCFDIGNTTAASLARFERTGDPMAGSPAEGAAGNGSLMRLAPVVLWYAGRPQEAIHFAAESSRTTHGAPVAIDCCRAFAAFLLRALAGETKPGVLAPLALQPPLRAEVRAVADGSFAGKQANRIQGSGYVLHSLEAALWAFATTDSFEEAVLAAANLGDDADTTAAITGQIAGAYYGLSGLPEKWLARLARRDEILVLGEALAVEAAVESLSS